MWSTYIAHYVCSFCWWFLFSWKSLCSAGLPRVAGFSSDISCWILWASLLVFMHAQSCLGFAGKVFFIHTPKSLCVKSTGFHFWAFGWIFVFSWNSFLNGAADKIFISSLAAFFVCKWCPNVFFPAESKPSAHWSKCECKFVNMSVSILQNLAL